MVDARKLMDLLVGASSRPGQAGADLMGTLGQLFGQATGGLKDMAQAANEATGGVGTKVDQAMGQAARQAAGGQSGAELAQKAKEFMNRHPGLAEAALMSVAGLLLGTRRGRGIASSLAGLGGLALVSGLAYRAYQNHQAGKPLLDAGAGGAAGAAALPQPTAFDPGEVTEDDALLMVRAMVAAATADGHMDETERNRIVSGLAQAGIDEETTRWLERELADPATVEEIADRVNSPEKAAQIYAAARVAIEPDTLQEREFLRQLAQSLDLDPKLRAHIDEAASAAKVTGP